MVGFFAQERPSGALHCEWVHKARQAESGHRVYFINAVGMTRKLAEATERNQPTRLIQSVTKIRLLVLDEVGYLELT